jgi:hypothetical protein
LWPLAHFHDRPATGAACDRKMHPTTLPSSSTS